MNFYIIDTRDTEYKPDRFGVAHNKGHFVMRTVTSIGRFYIYRTKLRRKIRRELEFDNEV